MVWDSLPQSCIAWQCREVFVFVCVLYAEESVSVLTYALPSVCIHMVIWINRETWAGSPATCFNYSRYFGWKLDHHGGSILPPRAPPLAAAPREREGRRDRKGDNWKRKKTPHLLSVVCSPKQAEWIIQSWCIMPKELCTKLSLPCRGIIGDCLGITYCNVNPARLLIFCIFSWV